MGLCLSAFGGYTYRTLIIGPPNTSFEWLGLSVWGVGAMLIQILLTVYR